LSRRLGTYTWRRPSFSAEDNGVGGRPYIRRRRPWRECPYPGGVVLTFGVLEGFVIEVMDSDLLSGFNA